MDFENMTKEDLIKYINSLGEIESWRFWLVWDKEKEPEKIVMDCDKKIPVFAEITEKSIDNWWTDNYLIEWDNFHALTALNYTHKEAIDIIYIDPPYNRGKKDFRYNDRYIREDDWYKHSMWLNFMEKRLKLARNLLNDNWVIFISIDDHEQAQLKLLCDKIFDINNCLGVLPTIMNLKGNQDEFWFAGTHEYTLVYAKNKQYCELGQFDVDEENIEKEWEQDDIWYYKQWANLKSTWGNAPREKRPNLFFPIYIWDDNNVRLERKNESDLEIFPITDWKEMSWRWSKQKIMDQNYDIIVSRSWNNVSLYKKQRPSLWDIPSKKPKSTFYRAEYSSWNGTAQITNMFGKKVFDNPKPIDLIKDFIYIGSRKKDAIILDFFAGSGTTWHAVLDLNKKDNGTRKFILCTNNENNICDEVTYPRVKIAITWKRIDGSKYSDWLKWSLRYFKTDFVANEWTKDQLYYDLTEKCIPMLHMKEDTFIEVESNNEYSIYTNNDKSKYTCVYFDIIGEKYDEFKEKLKNIKEEKALYIFTLWEWIDESDLRGINNYKVEAIPQRIYELYKKVVKISKLQ